MRITIKYDCPCLTNKHNTRQLPIAAYFIIFILQSQINFDFLLIIINFRACLNASAKAKASIDVSLLHIPNSDANVMHYLHSKLNFGEMLAAYSSIGWSIATAYFVVFIIKERRSSAKMMQMHYGMNTVYFWLCRLCWDFVILLLLALISIPFVYLPKELGYNKAFELCKNR